MMTPMPPPEAPEPPPAAPRSSRSTAAVADPRREYAGVFAVLLGGACAGLGFAVEAVAWESHLFRANGLHVATAACLLALAARAPVARLATALVGARGPVVAWRAVAFGAASLALYHAVRLEHMLTAWGSFFGWFRDLWECEPEGFGAPVVVAVAAYVGARTSLPSRARTRAGMALAAVAALALLAVAWRRAAQVPAVDAYIATLPRLGTLPPPTRPVPWDRGGQEDPSTTYTDHVVGGVTVRRFEFPHRGQCGLVRVTSDEPAPTVLPARYGLLRDCDGGEVRHDRARGLYVLVRREGAYPDVLPLDPPTAALANSMGGRTMGAYRDAFTVPAGWRHASAALVAAGALVLAMSAWRRRALGGEASWRQATLREDGVIAVEGSPAVYACPYGAALTPGPVVLVGVADAAGDGPFRGAPATLPREAVLPGLIADLRAEREATADADEARAMAAFVMAAAPLAGAAAVRLLG